MEIYYPVYSINNEGISGILVSDNAISIGTEDKIYIGYYDDFYNYLNEHFVKNEYQMKIIALMMTGNAKIFWNIKVYRIAWRRILYKK